jgi:hypothetical protein
MSRIGGAVIAVFALVLISQSAHQPAVAQVSSQTKIVLLGSGTPAIDPDLSGPATAIVVNDTPYLVDFGPGVVRRAKGAVIERGLNALEPTRLRDASPLGPYGQLRRLDLDALDAGSPWPVRGVWPERHSSDDRTFA